MNNISEKVKFIRKSNGLTQVEFADRLCVSNSYISRIEHAKDIPSPPVIRLISLIFSIDEQWLNQS